MKKRLQKFKHNITPRARKDRSGIQKLSTDKQKLIASLKARNPYAKNYTPNLAPHSKPRPILPTIDTSKQFMRYVPGPRTPGAKPKGFFTTDFVKGPSTPKGPKPKIPGPRTPTGPKPKTRTQSFGGKSRRKRRRKKKKTRKRRKKKTRRRRKKNMRGCSKKRRRR